MDAQKMENHRLAMEQLRTYMTTKKYWEGMNASDKKRVRDQSKRHKIKTAGGHSGIEATVKKITRLYYWGSVKNDVKYYIKRCPFCQTQRSSMSLNPRDDEELPRKKSKLQPTEVSKTKKGSSSTVLSARSSASSQSNVQPVKPKAGHRVPVTPSAQANVSLTSTRFAVASKKTDSSKVANVALSLQQQFHPANRNGLPQDIQEEMDSLCSKHQEEIEALTFSKLYLERQYATLEEELKAARTEVSTLNSSVARLTSSRASLSLEQAFGKIQADKEVIQQLRLELAGRDAIIDENNRKIREHEMQTIQHYSGT
ncbi:hypothetical protein C0Q70_21263 [Pomacea canaliculata]|uniref:Integrase zinc-binding domain-containing protein n=1 Tax=Pomacea canaliculata TaxID=400727 RepID=A0A2T7NC48_POMCA|nr:hypothetical protein C0Q70_21263 [Pomacea canaliculata]